MKPENSPSVVDDPDRSVISLDEARRRRQLRDHATRRARHDREQLGLDPWPSYQPARVVIAEALSDIGRALAEGAREIWRAARDLFPGRRP